MLRYTFALLACVVFSAPLIGCQGKSARFDPGLARDFFPLEPDSVWTYRINSKSQHSTYVVTDKAVGEKYVPSLNITGEVVEEYYNMDRGGTRPIVYITKNGYWTRLSGLDYSKQDIEAPAWGRSEEGEFMPAVLTPGINWKSRIFPFGHMPGSFDIRQLHRTFFEPADVIVPAGHFAGCMRIETEAMYEGGSYAKMGKPLRLVYEDYYAPHVGLVKTLALEGTARGREIERVELIRFLAAQSPKTAKSADAQGIAGK
ncbi:MAG TPA: hypothetical protein VJ728_09795 [Candidatus Binataceae bacterium]|nr:hypothetical protein [Candidatus Binataceae bacterium]